MDMYLDLIEQGYLMSTKHPTADLWLFNYTAKTQYEKAWNAITLSCRGLILDKNGQVMASPFPEFFNIEEHQTAEIPNLPFEVFEKMDGSLGILYWLNDKPFIATRGSFASEQALKATDWLHSIYADCIPKIQKDVTYLFEIIYPENKIVVDYGDIQGLFLLALIDNKTGQDLPLENIGFPIVKRYDGVSDLKELKQRNIPNNEGYVLRFQNGFRVKVKFEDYVRLHRIMTQFSNLSVWENLSTGTPFEELLERVPDEFYDWVKATKIELENKYLEIENECKNAFKAFESRKEAALYFKNQKYPSVLFLMLDGKDYSSNIWRIIQPTFSKPYRSDF
ncbi:MAG: hypothetical protein C7N36_05290 [Bacteroidetes bacterium]|nr:MAG: hypothetical protein C7N36_05290 [Bacteroidota bacterium]